MSGHKDWTFFCYIYIKYGFGKVIKTVCGYGYHYK